MLSGDSVLRRTALYLGEHVVRLGVAAVIGILVARHLGPAGLGTLTFVTAVFGILAPLSMLGAGPVMIREFTRHQSWREVLASALILQLAAALAVTVVAFMIVGLSRGWEPEALWIACALVPLPILTLSQSVRALLESRRAAGKVLAAGVGATAAGTSVKLVAIAQEAPVWVFAAATTIEALALAIGLTYGARIRPSFKTLKLHVNRALSRRVLRDSLPLLIAGLAVTIYMQIDIVLLGLLSTKSETGIYSAAAKISELWYFVPIAALSAIRPILSRHFHENEMSEYRRLILRFGTFSAGMSYLAIVGMVLFGSNFIDFLFGPEFAKSAEILRIHIFAAPFMFVAQAMNPWFIDRNLSGMILFRSLIGAVLNVCLNLLFIPDYGATGAAWATVISYASAGVLANGLRRATWPVLAMQVQSLLLLGGRGRGNSG